MSDSENPNQSVASKVGENLTNIGSSITNAVSSAVKKVSDTVSSSQTAGRHRRHLRFIDTHRRNHKKTLKKHRKGCKCAKCMSKKRKSSNKRSCKCKCTKCYSKKCSHKCRRH
jgi:cell shape-determining protein MreC